MWDFVVSWMNVNYAQMDAIAFLYGIFIFFMFTVLLLIGKILNYFRWTKELAQEIKTYSLQLTGIFVLAVAFLLFVSGGWSIVKQCNYDDACQNMGGELVCVNKTLTDMGYINSQVLIDTNPNLNLSSLLNNGYVNQTQNVTYNNSMPRTSR